MPLLTEVVASLGSAPYLWYPKPFGRQEDAMIGVILSLFAVLVGGSILVVGARVVRKMGAAPESDIGSH